MNPWCWCSVVCAVVGWCCRQTDSMWGTCTKFCAQEHKLLITDSGIEKKETGTLKCFNKHLSRPQAYTRHLSCPISVAAFVADFAQSVPMPLVRQQAARKVGNLCTAVSVCCFYSFSLALPWVGCSPLGCPCLSVRPPYCTFDASSCVSPAPCGCRSFVNQSVRGHHVLF